MRDYYEQRAPEYDDWWLGTGLFVGNLWYTNFSDRAACRTTGMTRFATFWIDEGEIVATYTLYPDLL